MFCLNDTMPLLSVSRKDGYAQGHRSLCGVVHEKMGCEVRNGDVLFIECLRFLK